MTNSIEIAGTTINFQQALKTNSTLLTAIVPPGTPQQYMKLLEQGMQNWANWLQTQHQTNATVSPIGNNRVQCDINTRLGEESGGLEAFQQLETQLRNAFVHYSPGEGVNQDVTQKAPTEIPTG
jgi:hypothetical protein